MLALRPSLIVGYHGCDESVCEHLLKNGQFKPNANDYHWLGHGAYFWECDPVRALRWAEEMPRYQARNRLPVTITKPAVVGAIVDPGSCLDLSVSTDISAVKQSYSALKAAFKQAGKALPKNRSTYYRELDCAVINYLCQELERSKYDTVRGYFVEGKKAYPNSFIREKNHIQICVRNFKCVLGYFRVQIDHLVD